MAEVPDREIGEETTEEKDFIMKAGQAGREDPDPVDPGSNKPKMMETGPIQPRKEISPILMISPIQIKNAIVIVARKIGETRKRIGQKLFVTDAINRVIMRPSVRNDSKNRKSVILREARTMTNPFSKRGSGRRGSLEGLRDSEVIVGISSHQV